jgi:hypothetical protein
LLREPGPDTVRAVLAALLVLTLLIPTCVLTDDVMCQGRPATIVGTWGTDSLLGTPEDDVIVGLENSDVI